MTAVLEERVAANEGPAPASARLEGPTPPLASDPRGPVLRPLLAATLAASAAALMTGGIFGSWSARLVACFGVVAGVAWAAWALRSRRQSLAQALLLPVALALGALSLLPGAGESGGPGKLPSLVGEAIDSGRLLRPPVPFDAGWRPILVVLMMLLGFGAAWVATAFARPKLAIGIPLPIVALTAITQPDDGQITAGVVAFVPILGALAVLFGGDAAQANELGRQFELKRAIRGIASAVPLVLGLILLNNASFLFPDPVYDPTDKPQKPKPIPLSEAKDRVLFEIETDGSFTGPWRAGTLDVYDGESWRLPPFDPSRFEEVGGDGRIGSAASGTSDVIVGFTVRDLGDSAALPGVATPSRIDIDRDVVFDPRTEIFRMPEGRVPDGISYTMSLPPYPAAPVLELAPAVDGGRFAGALEIGEPPPTVQRLLAQAPSDPWPRLDFLRTKLFEVVVAVGQGTPIDITPARVEEILDGDHEASPFEIVATEAMLARWAGVPSRIGFGFDGFNDEDGKKTVRPKNAAQWLEVYFEGSGWVPLIGTPPQARAELDSDPDARFNPNVRPSDDVAVEIYLPVELEDLTLLYERIRDLLLGLLPFVLVAVGFYLSLPALHRALRRRRRRRWAAEQGPRARIAVEYAEFRDLATDLNLGDACATPLEFLEFVVPDEEHLELAWLVSRSLYGDLAVHVGDDDARAAEEFSESLRRRLSQGQPVQTRAFAFLSRASLRNPFTMEVPTIRQLRIRRPRRSRPRRRRQPRLSVQLHRRNAQ